jgi:hypothetical protein
MRPLFDSLPSRTITRSISAASRTGLTISSTPRAGAASAIDCTNFSAYGRPASGLNRNAMRLTSGAIIVASSSHLLPISNSNAVKPVMLPPGCARFETKPCPTGSPTTTNTIGIVLVSFRTAFKHSVELAMITSGVSLTSSAA